MLPDTLFWLPPASANFREQAKAVPENGNGSRALVSLAGHRLDLNQLVLLARTLGKVDHAKLSDGIVSPLRLAMLGDATSNYLLPAIAASALRHGVLAECYAPEFGQSTQALIDPASELAAFNPDVVLIAPDHRMRGLDLPAVDAGLAAAKVASVVADMQAAIDRVLAMGAQPIVQTIAPPCEPWSGHFDANLGGSVSAQISRFNGELRSLANNTGAIVLDAAKLAATTGEARWHDHAQWYSAKLAFALDLIPFYADHVARLLGAIRGRTRKCLVLDLDNTLWGGVIGDDGLHGIELGQGSPNGEAFLAIQRYALALKDRGVVLAICSKNEEDAARLPFEAHPEMLLKLDDITVFSANWTDKASNLAHIAEILNIGRDALVFLDDNPAERARVRQMLPEVAVPELPDDPAWYPAAIAHAGYFEALALSADDINRAAQYRANAERSRAMVALGDMDSYLRSLNMMCDITHFDEFGRSRIAQLINKSNQYNLTTRRYTEAEVAAIEADPAKFAIQIRLSDRFGDNGMISVVIFDRGVEQWRCDTWLMSCRVLGRRVEEAALAVVAAAAASAGASYLSGSYIPSAKNSMVADHFQRLGFEMVTREESGASAWRLALKDFEQAELPMRISAFGKPQG